MFVVKLKRDKVLQKYGSNSTFSLMVADKRVTVGGVQITDNEFSQMNLNEVADLQAAIDLGVVELLNEGVPVKSVAEAEDSVIRSIGSAMMGDIVMSISPAAVEGVATSEAWTREVEITFRDASGNLHGWLSATFAGALSIADTSVAGTASIESTDLVVDKGKAAVVISGDAVDWLAAETDTLTIANLTIMGNTVNGGTSVQTFA